MSDKAAFVSSVYRRYRAQTSNVNVISPAFKRLLETRAVVTAGAALNVL